MAITKEEVKHIAELSRLGIGKDEIESYRKELSNILEFIGRLKEVKAGKINPMDQVVGLKNTLREDKVVLPDQKEVARLLKLVPKLKGESVQVKNIL